MDLCVYCMCIIVYTIYYEELGDDTKDASKALATKEECGSCYGAKPLREDGCCHSCQDVREAYVRMNWGKVDVKNVDQCVREGWLDKFENQVEEGCNIKGKLMVNKVRGSLRIAPANIFLSSVMTFEDLRRFLLNPVDEESFNLSHTIHKLKFGPDTANEPKAISAVTNVLGETEKKATQGDLFTDGDVFYSL